VVVEGREAFCCCYKSPARSLTPLSLLFSVLCYPTMPPPPGTQSSPQHRNPLESLFHCTASQHPSLLWFGYSIYLQPSSSDVLLSLKISWKGQFLTRRRSKVQMVFYEKTWIYQTGNWTINKLFSLYANLCQSTIDFSFLDWK